MRHRGLKVCLAISSGIAAMALSGPAWTRAYHSQTLDGLIARCSTINTSTLPVASLKRYDVEADADKGLLSCVVQKRDDQLEPQNVRARVEAEYHPIGQVPEPIEIRQVREQNLVTYLGTYSIRGESPLQFNVVMAVDDEAVEMNFDDQSPQL